MMTLVLEVFKTSASPGGGRGGRGGKGLMLQIDRRITSLIVLPKYTLALSVWFRYGILMLGCSLCLSFIFFVYHRQHVKQMVQMKGTSYDLVQDLLNGQSKSNWSAPLIQ